MRQLMVVLPLVVMIVHVHHVLGEGTELLHLQVMFTEQILKKTATVCKAATARRVLI